MYLVFQDVQVLVTLHIAVPCIHYIFLVMQPPVLLFESLPSLYLMVFSLPPSHPPTVF